MIERVYDDRTDETLFTGSEVECYAWIEANYPESHEDHDHIWIGLFYPKPTEEELILVKEIIKKHGLANAIETGELTQNDIQHGRLSELVHEMNDTLKMFNRIVNQ